MNFIKTKLGILGGGQLGRMFIQSAMSYGTPIHILDPNPNCPAANLCDSFTQGSFNDYDTVFDFGSGMDVLTIEIENVNTEALFQLEREGVKVFPQPHIIKLIKDKGVQKQFYKDNNIPTADFELCDSLEEVEQKATFPIVQKMRKGGYDGKGVQILKSPEDLEDAFDVPSLLEEKIDFVKEVSVIVARNEKGEIRSYPTCEQEFNPEANLVEFLFSPAKISQETEKQAQGIAKTIIEKLKMVGLLAVEFFVLEDGSLIVNEMAPRTHNSGHHTMECNYTSQFEQHYRSVMNFPLGSTEIIQPGVMINLLGDKNHTGTPVYEGINEVIKQQGVYVHLYGKTETKPFRKMGHITVVNPDLDKAIANAREVAKSVKVVA
ncbi:MAG: 5-(carboxyamino)imidazole ribonucleotide synthase [Urechidicola sp.]|jgi:5-(carboxyamino)imidazole ribonucleotide synthase|tara:strand:+ start:1554 stop:2684 length:1131 start_codon:yes stop_codon:yes gene_type:complete